MTFLDAVVLALATTRITLLMTTDTIFDGLRERIWRRFPPERSRYGYLITCNWCSSMYAATLVVSMYTIEEKLTLFVCAILALSCIAGFAANRAN